MADHVSKQSDGLTLVPEDGHVTQLTVDYRFSLVLGGGIYIVLEGPFLLFRPGLEDPIEVPSGEVWEVESALPLFGDRVETAVAKHSGELYLAFASGSRIESPTQERYENYQVLFPDGTMWIGSAGGGLVTFPPHS